jgi:hypothetical protein
MYMWKYWRESRISFAIAVLVLVGSYFAILKIPKAPQGVALAATADAVAIGLLAFPLSFLAWRFGSFGVGHDLGEKSGAYMFTRPRTRAFFVWSDWSYGMAQLFAIVVAMVLSVEYAFQRAASGPRLLNFSGESVDSFSLTCLHCVTVTLFIGLIFGLTYFCSVAARSKGMMMAAGILLTYLVLKVIVGHYWPQTVLPDFMMSEFKITGGRLIGFADNLALSIALRAAVALAFPIGAQLLLQKRDID